MNLGPQIIELRNQGKTYLEIRDILKCSLGTICYHCRIGQKVKINTAKKLHRNQEHPYSMKLTTFKGQRPTKKQLTIYKTKINKIIYLKICTFHTMKGRKRTKMSEIQLNFTVKDIIDKFGEKPKCYLTGQEIDIYQPKTYHFDHIIPISKGGQNTLDNLGICTRNANMAKSDMLLSEFVELCKKVIETQSGR